MFANHKGSGVRINALLSVLVLLFLNLASIHAQNLFGTLVGNIVDASSGAVPGATVTIIGQDTGLTRNAVTNDRGEYDFQNLPSGAYRLTATKQGFRTEVKSGVDVAVNAVARADFSLNVGDVTQSVEVRADAVTLKTDKSDTTASITASQFQDLPVAPGRDYENLFKTIPGVSALSGPQASVNVPSAPTGGFNINGLGGYTRTTTIDGAPEMDIWIASGPVSYVPTLESIQQVDVTTGSIGAEVGGSAGGSVALTIKSGTNSLHGSAFEDFTNQKLVARPATAASGFEKPHLVSNIFGGSLGGPILKNKLFYFASYQANIYRTSQNSFATVPTALMETGNLSESPTPIYDPNTGTSTGTGRTPFVGNIIPASRFDPIMASLMKYYPLPTLPQNGFTNNYLLSPVNNTNTHAGDTKISYNPTSKLSIFGRLGIVNFTNWTGSPFANIQVPIPNQTKPLVGSTSPNTAPLSAGVGAGDQSGRTYSVTGAATYVVSPKLIVDGNVGYTGEQTDLLQMGYGGNIGQALGIPGTNGPADYQSGWPQLTFTNFASIGTGAQFFPWHRHNPTYNFQLNATWIKGGHTFKFGSSWGKQALDHIQAEYTAGNNAFGAQGGFAFGNTLTTLNGGPAPNAWNSMASILLGVVSAEGKNVMTNGILTTRQTMNSLYAQDQWRVNSKLTANLGLRWEDYPMLTRKDRGVESYNFGNNTVSLCGTAGIPLDCGVPPSRTFSPRIGIAYRFAKDFVFRVGYSLATDPTPLVRDYRGSYPELIAYYISSGANTPSVYVPVGTLSQGLAAVPTPVVASDGTSVLPPGVGFVTTLPNFKRGYYQSWNATVEKQFGPGTLVSIAYVATRTNGMHTTLDYNSTPLGCNFTCQPLYQAFGRTNSMPVESTIGNAHYDAGEVRVSRRLKTYTISGWFIYARDIGQLSGYGGLATAGSYGKLYRGNLADPPPYQMNVSFDANLPFGNNQPFLTAGIPAKLLGNWKVSGVFTALAGNRFGITGGGTLQSVGGPTNRASWAPGITSLEKLGNIGINQSWFNPMDFVSTPSGVLGNTAPNMLVGPTTYNLDGRLTRQFPIGERLKMEVRAEAFNVSNTPQWGNPGTNVNSILRNADGSIKDLGGFSSITATRTTNRSSGPQRQLQFTIHFAF